MPAPSVIDYKLGIKTLSPAPTGDGGAFIVEQIEAIADVLEGQAGDIADKASATSVTAEAAARANADTALAGQIADETAARENADGTNATAIASEAAARQAADDALGTAKADRTELTDYATVFALNTVAGTVADKADASDLATLETQFETYTSGNDSDIDGIQTALATKAPLVSPGFTGTPTTPTAANGTNTTQIASCAFVAASVSALATVYAPITHTHTASQISDSTAAGRAVLVAADAAAQRTALGLGSLATLSTASVTVGGTGLTSANAGDMLYASSLNTLARVAGNTTATKMLLSMTGGTPAWGQLVGADIPNLSAVYLSLSAGGTVGGAVTLDQVALRLKSSFGGVSTLQAGTDPLNTSQDALFLSPSATGRRFYFGTSSIAPYSLYLGYVTAGIEGLKTLTISGASGQVFSSTSTGSGVVAGFGANNSANIFTIDYGTNGTNVTLKSTYQGLRLESAASDVSLVPGSGRVTVAGTLQLATINTSSTPGTVAGQLCYSSTLSKVCEWDGSTWQPLR